MKLDVAVNEVVLSNVGTTGEFKIRNSAKAFKILSDGLYSNKIRAIVRELSCNALDSHVGAGKADVPFEVHLPTVLEPWFSVRDFGLGLSGDQVVNIYTTYFESTKTDSNAFIGALGLGSKSPFSYTENFTVTAIKDGIKRIYSAFINEAGVPSIAEMGEELTDEGNGVEVKFSVTDRHDYSSFQNEARRVFMWFDRKPTVIGVHGFECREPEYKEMNIIPGVHVRDTNECIALMGNIAYPLNNIPDIEKHLGDLASLIQCGLVLTFEIGELDFAASREQLSYIPLTLNNIRKKLDELNVNLAGHLATKVNAVQNEWERAHMLYIEYQSRLYRSAVIKYVADTNFPLFDPASYHGKKDFKYTIPDLEARGLEIKAFRNNHGQASRITESSEYINNNYVKTVHFPVDKDVVIVLNDLKTGCYSRARYHYQSIGHRRTVFCVSHIDPDPAVRQAEYDKLIAELHTPPVIIKASQLQKPERRKSMPTQGIMELGLKSDRIAGSEDAYTWVPHNEPFDENETYYYVTLLNHKAVDDRGQELPVFAIRELMDQCGVSGITDIKIFGVRKNRIKEIAELDNWIWFEDALKKETAKITDDHVASLVAAEMLDSYYNRVYTSTDVAKRVSPDSCYAKFTKKYTNLKRANGNVTHLVELCGKYGKAVQVEEVKKKIEDAKTGLFTKYPLLKHMNNSVDSVDVAHYINLVDKQ